MPETLRIGLDIGSTTIKCVVLDEADKIIYSCYERHLSLIAQKTRELLTRLDNEVVNPTKRPWPPCWRQKGLQRTRT